MMCVAGRRAGTGSGTGAGAKDGAGACIVCRDTVRRTGPVAGEARMEAAPE